MSEASDLIQRLRQRAAEVRESLPPPASLAAVQDAEVSLGFHLPELIVAIYTTLANGGIGPGIDVPIPGYNAGRLYSVERLVEVHHAKVNPPIGSPYCPWPRGIVAILTWGGFSEAAVDCFDGAAPVLRYDADVETVTPEMAWKVDSHDLETWWTRWLDGDMKEPTELWNRVDR
jgi:hypothetical protein